MARRFLTGLWDEVFAVKLALNGLGKYLAGLVLVGLLLFLPAGTWRYSGAWLFIGLLFGPMLILGLVLLLKSPTLLKKRLSAKEKEGAQRGVVGVSALLFTVGFIVAGLDFRFGWSAVPTWAVCIASAVFLLAYLLYAEVMRENAYLSRTVEVQEGQKVIDTGLYGVVRHPMYLATSLLFLSMPVVLGSWYALAVFALFPLLLAVRIRSEEAMLVRDLPGYAEYRQRVRYRMLPYLW
ncbi:MAG: isoprenylcysteine carboxylmethyltransferase family protein [Clostridia bacterium]|nr:isoprenylcysteine carboxylmethyltransferase family protein [Clostridia bacterium]